MHKRKGLCTTNGCMRREHSGGLCHACHEWYKAHGARPAWPAPAYKGGKNTPRPTVPEETRRARKQEWTDTGGVMTFSPEQEIRIARAGECMDRAVVIPPCPYCPGRPCINPSAHGRWQRAKEQAERLRRAEMDKLIKEQDLLQAA